MTPADMEFQAVKVGDVITRAISVKDPHPKAVAAARVKVRNSCVRAIEAARQTGKTFEVSCVAVFDPRNRVKMVLLAERLT